MAGESRVRTGELTYEILEERISYLEFLKSLHHETLGIMRRHSENGHLSLEKCLFDVVDFIRRKLDIYLVSVFLIDEAAADLVLLTSSGEPQVTGSQHPLRLKIGEGLTGLCARTGQTIVVQDVASDARFIRGTCEKTQSEVCIPIRVEGRIGGVLDFQDAQRNRFRRDLVSTLEEVALSLGLLIENHNLYSQLLQYSQQLEVKIEQKVTEVKKSEERYRMLVENIQHPIFIIDFGAHVLWANPATLEFFGLAHEDFIGKNISQFLKKGNMFKVYNVLQQVQEGRTVKDVKLEALTKNGTEEKVVELTCTPIVQDGRPIHCEVMLRDVTERITVERLKKNYLKTLEEEVQSRTAEVKDIQRASILAIATLAESIDNYTYGHLQRMRHYARIIADELRRNPKKPEHEAITEEYVDLIFDLSPLHDIGKVGIRDSILQKEDKLTRDEFEKMKEHTEIGANALRMAGQMIRRESMFAIAEMIARFHHQKWDGSGYPAVMIHGEFRPLRGEEIPLCARIVALADVYDALTSRRPYKEPYPHEKAKEMILKDSGKHFDPDCVAAFLAREADFLKIKAQYPDTQPNGSDQTLRLSMRDAASDSATAGSP